MGFGEVRLDRESLAVAGLGFRQPALLLEGIAQVVVRLGHNPA